MKAIIKIEDRIVNVTAEPGCTLEQAIHECYRISEIYRTDVSLTFNSKTNLINRFTDLNKIKKEFFNQ